MNKLILPFLSVLLVACGGEENQALETVDNVEEQLEESLQALNATEQSDWITVEDSGLCQLEIPAAMELMERLNPDATIKYGEVRQEEDKVYENYVLVLPETYEEIESYELDVEFDLETYNQACLDKLTNGLASFADYTIEDTQLDGSSAKIQKLVGTKQVKEDLSIDIFYELAVVKGKKGYFQILSWTLADQRSVYEEDMDKMTNSFQEI